MKSISNGDLMAFHGNESISTIGKWSSSVNGIYTHPLVVFHRYGTWMNMVETDDFHMMMLPL